MVMIDVPRRRRRQPVAASEATAVAAGQAAADAVRVLGIEVTQSIQNMAHNVRLIAGKRTVVRVYLDASALGRVAKVRGELVVSEAAGRPARYVVSANEVALRTDTHPSLPEQRLDAALSLNFVIDAPNGSSIYVALKRLFPAAGGADLPLAADASARSVQLVAGPSLHVRAVGLRYADTRFDPPQNRSPGPIHFDRLRSYLLRAYPTATLEWSQIVVPAPASFGPPFSDGNDPDVRWNGLLQTAHNFLAQLRQSDIKGGIDRRTHYYGLVADDAGFFRGAAKSVPTSPNPGVVAVGPAGIGPANAWYTGTYADWYGAHELAHTFGRMHPGFCDGNSHDDLRFPYADGCISNAEQDHIGFDVGDPDLGIEMRAFGHQQWHDIMTYCDRQWISAYTYDGIYQRVLDEQALFARVPVG